MQKLGLIQTLQQKLSPQQIQFIKLLQIPTAELDTRIEEELETNPALEEGPDDDEMESLPQDEEQETVPDTDKNDDVSLEDYLQDDYTGYKMQGDGMNPDDEDREIPIPSTKNLTDQLLDQLGLLGLDDHQAPGIGDLDWDFIAANLPADIPRVCEMGRWNDRDDARKVVPFLQAKGII